jgi:hypothetical protein
MTSPLENDVHRHHLVTLLTELLLRALRHGGADRSNEHEHDDQIDAGGVGPVRAKVGGDDGAVQG